MPVAVERVSYFMEIRTMNTLNATSTVFTEDGLTLIHRKAFIEVGYNYLSLLKETGRITATTKRARSTFADVLRRDIETEFRIAEDHDFDTTVTGVLQKISASWNLPDESDFEEVAA